MIIALVLGEIQWMLLFDFSHAVKLPMDSEMKSKMRLGLWVVRVRVEFKMAHGLCKV